MLLEAVPAAADGWVSAAFASPGFPSGKVPSQAGILDIHIEEFAEIGYSAALTRTHAHLPHMATHPRDHLTGTDHRDVRAAARTAPAAALDGRLSVDCFGFLEDMPRPSRR